MTVPYGAPIFNLRVVPREARGWVNQLLQVAASKLRFDNDSRLIVDGGSRVAERPSTDVTTLLGYITDAGKASSQVFLPQVASTNKASVQSAQPISATDAGTNATISISSHSVQYGFGTVSYNSGSITGLNYTTLYYVYTDDPNYAGGAVTYVASTNASNVTANNGRYYLGKVTTPAGGGGGTSGGWGGGGGGGGNPIP